MQKKRVSFRPDSADALLEWSSDCTIPVGIHRRSSSQKFRVKHATRIPKDGELDFFADGTILNFFTLGEPG